MKKILSIICVFAIALSLGFNPVLAANANSSYYYAVSYSVSDFTLESINIEQGDESLNVSFKITSDYTETDIYISYLESNVSITTDENGSAEYTLALDYEEFSEGQDIVIWFYYFVSEYDEEYDSFTENQIMIAGLEISYSEGEETNEQDLYDDYGEPDIEEDDDDNYSDYVSVVVTATKSLSDPANTGISLEAGEFSFQITDENGNVVSTGTNDADGLITFNAIKFTATGTYNYSMSEIAGDNSYIEYSTDVFDFSITVEYVDEILTITSIE